MSTLPTDLQTLPPDYHLISHRVRRTYDGVVGTFWAWRQHAGRAQDEPVLSVHVHRKRPLRDLPPEQRIPGSLCGLATDVVEVGQPVHHALRVPALVWTSDENDPAARRSSITAIVQERTGSLLAIACAHGVLPLQPSDGGPVLPGFYSGGRPPSVVKAFRSVRTRDPVAPLLPWDIRFGRLGPEADFALLTRTLDPSLPLQPPLHQPLDMVCPLPTFARPAGNTWEVGFHSAGRDRLMGGFVRGVAGSIDLAGLGGRLYSHTNALWIEAATGDPFSVPGDSGALLVSRTPDGNPGCVGTVLGGTGRHSYALEIASLVLWLRMLDKDRWFFRDCTIPARSPLLSP